MLQGLALGLLLGVCVQLLRAMVNGNIDAFAPLAFAIVPLPLITAAFVACYLPARRAAPVDSTTPSGICRSGNLEMSRILTFPHFQISKFPCSTIALRC